MPLPAVIPTYAVAPSGMVALPSVVQLVPSADVDAVTVEPMRRARTHCGGAAAPGYVRTAFAPVLICCWKNVPEPADTSAAPYVAFAAVPLRIITPAAEFASAYETESTRAVTSTSPT